ncbi:MAG: serine/threonine protein kinase [Planctomycetota bacterium]|nr:MAG: serine/threonine protein kinase [Planctomycetota bacterium]
MAALVGATLRDRYRLEEALGSGAFATVYRARDLLLGRQVAVKVVDEATASPQALARFAREGRIACKVDSEWVARVFDQGEHAGLRFLVQEFVDGEALAARVARAGPLSPGDVLRVGVLLSAGLEALHAEGILHRDLKPENVVLSSAGGAKIVDFGVAAAEEAPSPRLTDPRALLGTPLTLAPEVVSGGASCASAASDVYALAATLAFAATGRCPHDPERGDGTGFLLRRAFEPAEDLRALRPELPEPLCAWIARCLDRDPAARPSVAELHEGLGALHRSPPRGVPTAARRRAPIALGAVGVVGSLALSLAAIRAQWPGEESAHRAAVTDRPREGGDGAQADRALSPQRRPGPGPSPGSEGAPLPRDPGAAERRRGAGSGRAGEGLRSPGGASGAARGALPLPVRGSAGEGGPLPPPIGGRAGKGGHCTKPSPLRPGR